jgi:hypothetical protein
MRKTRSAHSESGQAAVEAALTLPLTVFLVLGTLQMFLLLQARVLTEYAAFKAVRTGVVKYGDCRPMTHAAIGALLPAFARTDSAATLGASFRAHADNQYTAQRDAGHTGSIVWIARERPLPGEIPADEEESFDDPERYQRVDDVVRLEARLVFWYPMRIPFANWVLSRMFMAHLGLLDYAANNPLMPTQQAAWGQRTDFTMEQAIRQELLERVNRKEYVFPLQATYAMRMMTPVRPRYFETQNCPPTPEAL